MAIIKQNVNDEEIMNDIVSTILRSTLGTKLMSDYLDFMGLFTDDRPQMDWDEIAEIQTVIALTRIGLGNKNWAEWK